MMRREARGAGPHELQRDIFEALYPACPTCEGTGERIISVSMRGVSVNHDWRMMKFQAMALGNWEKVDPAMRELIERQVARARWSEGERECQRCERCEGAGVLIPEREREREVLEAKVRAFFNRGSENPLEY